LIPTRIEPSAEPSDLGPRQVGREFRRLLDEGMRIRPAGTAGRSPRSLLSGGYAPRYKTELFDTTFYLSKLHQNADNRFFVAYVVRSCARSARTAS
jgi:hypothetical protein